MNRKHFTMSVLIALVLLVVAFVPVSNQEGTYDPWYDLNDDGKIDGKDIARVSKGFGTLGTPITKASIGYDSGWINISDKHGQYFYIHSGFNLETSTWIPTIYGRAIAGGSMHEKYWYGYGMPGWNRTLGGTDDDQGFSIAKTSDGGYAVAGVTNSFPWDGGQSQAYLVKMSADDLMEWQQTYGGGMDDYGYCVVETNDGGYAVAGYTYSFGEGTPTYPNVYLVKTDSFGIVQWNKTYGGARDDCGYSVVETSDGGYAVAGYTYSFGEGTPTYPNVYLVKTDSFGIVQWNKTYGGARDDCGYSVVETSDGGYAIAGFCYVSSLNVGDMWLIKTDSLGNHMWNSTEGTGVGLDEAYSIVQTSDGGYAMAGRSAIYGPTLSHQVCLVKTYADGTIAWNKTYGGATADCGYSVVQTADGGYAIAGTLAEQLAFYSQAYLVKTDASGSMMWNRTYGGAWRDYGRSVVEANDGGYVLVGYTYCYGSGTPGNPNVYLIKTDAFGLKDLDVGVTITDFAGDTLFFYRGLIDPYYNFIRVQIWVVRENP